MACRFLARGLVGRRMRGARKAPCKEGNCPSRARKLFGAPSLRAFLAKSAPCSRRFAPPWASLAENGDNLHNLRHGIRKIGLGASDCNYYWTRPEMLAPELCFILGQAFSEHIHGRMNLLGNDSSFTNLLDGEWIFRINKSSD